MGNVVPLRKKAQLRCPSCDATTNAPCECGVDYVYVPAREIARKAVAQSPEKSNRAIAADTGLSEASVRRARTASKDAVTKRVGRDGKARRAPAKKATSQAAKKLRETIGYQIGQGQGLAGYVVASSWRTRVTKPNPMLIDAAKNAAAEWRKVEKALSGRDDVGKPFGMSCRAGVYGNAQGAIEAARKALAAAEKLKTKGHARDDLAGDAQQVAEFWEIVVHLCTQENVK